MRNVLLVSFALALCVAVAEGQNVRRGVRVSYVITDAQMQFVDEHFDFVMTPFLSQKVRSSFKRARLFLYRSIQGTWTGFDQFDWNHINAHETMFCHTDSTVQDTSTRILTIWDSWLMDGNDLVAKSAPDALDHWVNYFAVTAAEQVHTYGYDGLYIDSASHMLRPSWLKNGVLPWDYDPDTWRDGRYAALSFIKSYLPDKQVIFNGLHSDNGADSSLTLTDGGMWEDFAYDIETGAYKGEGSWWRAIQCMQANRDRAYLVLVVKKPGLIPDIQARIFSVASYLLISNANVVLSLSDYAHNTSLQYYPEFEIRLGEPLGDFSMRADSLFVRGFERGLVVVNPFSSRSKLFPLEKAYDKVVPVGGGFVSPDGQCDGRLRYEKVSGMLTLPPASAVILRDGGATRVRGAAQARSPLQAELWPNYPNPFNASTRIQYTLAYPAHVDLRIVNALGQTVRVLVSGNVVAGVHRVHWDGTNGTGALVESGVYFCRLKVDGKNLGTRALLLLK